MNALTQFFRKIYDWILSMANHKFALPVLAALTFFEAIFFPLPTDPLLMAMGLNKPKKSIFFALFTTVFSVLGAIAGYMLGAYMWNAISPWLFQYILSESVFQTVMDKYRDHVFLTVFVAGFTPVPFKVFTLAGGVAQVAFLPFTLAAACSRGLRYLIIGGLIYAMGDAAKDWIEKHFNKLSIVVAVAIVLMVSFVFFLKGS